MNNSRPIHLSVHIDGRGFDDHCQKFSPFHTTLQLLQEAREKLGGEKLQAKIKFENDRYLTIQSLDGFVRHSRVCGPLEWVYLPRAPKGNAPYYEMSEWDPPLANGDHERMNSERFRSKHSVMPKSQYNVFFVDGHRTGDHALIQRDFDELRAGRKNLLPDTDLHLVISNCCFSTEMDCIRAIGPSRGLLVAMIGHGFFLGFPLAETVMNLWPMVQEEYPSKGRVAESLLKSYETASSPWAVQRNMAVIDTDEFQRFVAASARFLSHLRDFLGASGDMITRFRVQDVVHDSMEFWGDEHKQEGYGDVGAILHGVSRLSLHPTLQDDVQVAFKHLEKARLGMHRRESFNPSFPLAGMTWQTKRIMNGLFPGYEEAA